ncbi:MAG: hypothetical protein IH593_05205, partial [Bacteroidales bacterium]|nr:hypothetical protein [Bacteroidales bacterium]
MKNLILTTILALLIASATTVAAQDYPEEYLGLPGDNLNLYAVMDLFRNSETLEAFERSLNDQDSRINNLDLNGDNRVDYITVSDYIDRKVHTIVLRAIIGRNEYQDVAVITVEKLRRKKVMIQLIGDEALYGRNYIIEPVYAKRPNPGYYPNPVYADNVTVINNYYDMWDWPVVVYIYNPHYIGWHSSWYWGYYPTYWDPWRPYYWDYYYGYHSGWYPHYYAHYHHWDYPRYRHYNDFYYHGIRESSPQVQHRIAEGNYRDTYSRPEQRREGVALYTSTHTTRTVESQNSAGVDSQGRRASAPQSTRDQSAADRTGDERRSAAGTGDERRSAATVSSRPNTSTSSGQGNGETRRAAATANDRPAATAVERRETQQPVQTTRTSSQSRTQDIRAAEAGAAERRSEEARAAESRAAEARAAESRAAESRAAEARAAENRAAQAREAQARESQARAAESRAAEARAAESRAAQAREAQSRETQNRANEARAAESRDAEARA